MKCHKEAELPVGSKLYEQNGYVRIKVAPGEWMLEHRYVMEQKIGRKLSTKECIHHIDENKQNNAIENLVLCASLREHLETYHADILVNPPVHHNGRKPIKLGPQPKQNRKKAMAS